MQAIKAVFEKGNIRWIEEPPTDDSVEVTVLFPTKQKRKDGMSTEEALRIVEKYAGSITRDIDYEKERDEYLNEKYGPFN